MDRQDMCNQVDELLGQIAEIEEQMEDTTLPHSDQQLLDQAWEDLQNQVALLQEAIEMGDDAHEQEMEEDDSPPLTAEELEYAELLYKLKSDKIDYYESDYGVYYNAADEV